MKFSKKAKSQWKKSESDIGLNAKGHRGILEGVMECSKTELWQFNKLFKFTKFIQLFIIQKFIHLDKFTKIDQILHVTCEFIICKLCSCKIGKFIACKLHYKIKLSGLWWSQQRKVVIWKTLTQHTHVQGRERSLTPPPTNTYLHISILKQAMLWGKGQD